MNKSTGNIRRKNSSLWEGRFVVDGKRKSIYGSSYREVKAAIMLAITEADNGLYIDETTMTVSQWLQLWLNEYSNVRVSTWIRYERDIRLYITPVLGKIRVKDSS